MIPVDDARMGRTAYYRNRIIDKGRCEMKDASFSITFFHGLSHTDRWRQIWYSKLINAKEGRS